MGGIQLSQPTGVGTQNAAGLTHPPPITVDNGLICFLSPVNVSTTTWRWTLTRPTGSSAALSSGTSPGPSFVPDVPGGSFTLTLLDDNSNLYQLDIVQASSSPVVGQGGSNALAANIAWWGASNANFYNASNGKWYQDAGLTTEATDDAYKFQAAVTYVAGLGGGGIYVPRGTWYFKTLCGSYNNFFDLASNVTLFGDGDQSILYVAPGLVQAGGYTAVIGGQDYTHPKNNVQVRNLRVHHNSKFNQFPSSNFGGFGVRSWCSSVMVQAGDRVLVENVTSYFHAGVFAVLLGTYGFPNLQTNSYILNCHALHEGDDPNVGDCSVYAAGVTNGGVVGCTIDNDSANNIAWPTGNNVITAIEVHGFNCKVDHNVVNDLQRGVNFAADSTHHDTSTIQGNLLGGTYGVISGITFYQLAGHFLSRIDCSHNVIKTRQGLPGFGEAGISEATAAALSSTDGNGMVDCAIHDNTLVFATGTPTHGLSFGIQLSQRSTRLRVYNNDISGYDEFGIGIQTITRNASDNFTRSGSTLNSTGHHGLNGWECIPFSTGTLPAPLSPGVHYFVVNATANTLQLAATQGGTPITLTSAGTGTHSLIWNLQEDVHVHNNSIKNCGLYGIIIGGVGSEAGPDTIRLAVYHNSIVDDRAASALDTGVYIACQIDGNSRTSPNRVFGYVSAAVGFNTGAFPGIGPANETTNGPFAVNGNGFVTGSLKVGAATAALQSLHVVGNMLSETNTMQRGDNAGVAMLWGDHWASFSTDMVFKDPTGAITYGFVDSSGIRSQQALLFGGASGSRFIDGSGSPEGVVTANKGYHYSDHTNGALYIFTGTNGTNTGWKLVTHA